LVATGWACRSERLRPGPPAVAITLGQSVAGPLDTISGSVLATAPEGLDSVIVVVGDERLAVDGRLDTEVQFSFRWPLELRFFPGDTAFFVAIAKDLERFTASDTAPVVIE
jgi:hypothetical protein